MLLCIDIGNTNTVLATFDGDKLVHSWRIKTDARSTADELGLTPIDALAVRWALLQRARLIDVLRDYQSGKTTGMEGAIKAASRVGMNDAYKQCWDAALDDKRIHAVEALMNGRKFSPAIP